MSVRWILGLMVLSIPAGCGRSDSRRSQECDARIYESALSLPQFRNGFSGKTAQLLVVQDKTVIWSIDKGVDESDRWGWFQKRLPGLARATYDHFWESNAVTRTVNLTSATGIRVRIVTDAELDSAFGSDTDFDSWVRFRQTFPGSSGLLALSAPGVGQHGNQAMVYVEHTMDYVGGSGSYYLLERDGDEWRVTQDYLVWTG